MEEPLWDYLTINGGDTMKKIIIFSSLLLLLSVSVANAELIVEIPDASGKVGDVINIPVNVKDAKSVGSMDIAITYDPSIVSIEKVEKGSLSKGIVSSNTENPGIIIVSVVDSSGINGDGEVVKLTFKLLKEGSTPLKIENVKAYDANTHIDIIAATSDGSITVENGGIQNYLMYGVIALIVIIIGGLAVFWKKSK